MHLFHLNILQQSQRIIHIDGNVFLQNTFDNFEKWVGWVNVIWNKIKLAHIVRKLCVSAMFHIC